MSRLPDRLAIAPVIGYGLLVVFLNPLRTHPAIFWEGFLSVTVGLALAFGLIWLIFAAFKDGDA